MVSLHVINKLQILTTETTLQSMWDVGGYKSVET